jgi:hypothetical protein
MVADSHSRTVAFIPGRLRGRWSRILSSTLQRVTQTPSDLGRWVEVFCLPKLLFFHPPRPSSSQERLLQPSMHAVITARMDLWEAGATGRDALFDQLLRLPDPAPSSDSTEARNLRRCLELSELGRLGDAAKSLASRGTVPPSPSSLAALQLLHPPADLPNPQPNPPAALVPEDGDVMAALRAFPKGTAAGPSGLWAQHLLDGCRTPLPHLNEACASVLSAFVSLLLAGRLPEPLAPFLTSSRLVALGKPNSGLRPVAIGEIWRRLASKVAARAVKAEAMAYFSPLQLGVGVPEGAAAIVHAVQACIQSQGGDPEVAMLKIDFSNAFNLVSRQAIFQEVRATFPSLSRWVEQCYGIANPLHFGDDTLRGLCGVQQGDPLGPLLFALVMQPLVLRVKRACPLIPLQAYYLDDGTLLGPPAQLAQALDIIGREGPALGLHLNLSKCEVWWPTMPPSLATHFPAAVQLVAASGISLLGSPLGDAAFAEGLVGTRVQGITGTLQHLGRLDDAQVELALLRSCLGFPKFVFSLRTCAPSLIPRAIAAFDEAIDASLRNVLGSQGYGHATRVQIGLRASQGGLGIPSAASRALPAFLASVSRSAPLQRSLLPPTYVPLPRAEFGPAWASFCTTFPQPTPLSLPLLEGSSKPQQWLSRMVEGAEEASLLATTDHRTLARLKSVSLPYGGGWLLAPPIRSLGFRLASRPFRLLLRYRLGLPLASSPMPCPMCADGVATLDIYGDHAASCQGVVGRSYRHNRLRDALHKHALAAGFSAEKEPHHLIENHPDLRPADVLINDWQSGKAVCLDVSVANPCCTSTLVTVGTRAAHAATLLERGKLAKYATLCTANQLLFIPVVMETFGGFGPSAVAVIARIGRALSDHSDLEVECAQHRLGAVLSFACQKALAKSLINRYAPALLLDE